MPSPGCGPPTAHASPRARHARGRRLGSAAIRTSAPSSACAGRRGTPSREAYGRPWPVRSSIIDWVLFVTLGFFWGSSYLFIKIGVETLTPFTLVAGRLAVGLALLALVLVLRRPRLPRDRRSYGHLVAMAVLNVVVPFALITWGEQTIDSALAAILTATVPLFVIVLAAVALSDEPITANRVVGLLVGFAGIVLITSPSLGASTASARPASGLIGQLAMIGASLSYAAGNVYARRFARGQAPMISAFFQVFFAFLITIVLAFVFEAPLATRVETSTVVSIVWLGLLGSGLAYLIWYRLLGRWGSTRVSLVAYLLPVVGIALGYFILHEQIDARVLGGSAFIIAGVALVNSRVGIRLRR